MYDAVSRTDIRSSIAGVVTDSKKNRGGVYKLLKTSGKVDEVVIGIPGCNMFPKGIQFANTPWDCAVEKFHQMRNYYPTSIVISGVHNVQEVTIQWENFISELKLTISQPLVAYKLTSEFLVTNFIEVNVDPCLCLSSLLSANFFNKCSKLDTHAFGLLISVIKEKFGYIGIQRFFPYIFKPLLSVELSVSEDGSYSLSQMELLNQLKKLTKFCIIILSYDFFCYLSNSTQLISYSIG
ncbi:unnamed protein product [Heterobilharzia americana]|nr:unnamed protein product [Heterobilharzia americana]